MSFRAVVHSVRTEAIGVTRLQHPSEGPNEHPQECPSHAAASRGDGAVGARRRIFPKPMRRTFIACRPTSWGVGSSDIWRSSSGRTKPKASRYCRAVGRGAHIRMTGATPQTGQGLAEIHCFRRSLDIRRPHSAAHTPARKSLI